jgi:hypothetical protein
MKCKVPRTQALSLGITFPLCPLAACDVPDVISASVAAALAASGSKSAAQTTHTRSRSLEAKEQYLRFTCRTGSGTGDSLAALAVGA